MGFHTEGAHALMLFGLPSDYVVNFKYEFLKDDLNNEKEVRLFESAMSLSKGDNASKISANMIGCLLLYRCIYSVTGQTSHQLPAAEEILILTDIVLRLQDGKPIPHYQYPENYFSTADSYSRRMMYWDYMNTGDISHIHSMFFSLSANVTNHPIYRSWVVEKYGDVRVGVL